MGIKSLECRDTSVCVYSSELWRLEFRAVTVCERQVSAVTWDAPHLPEPDDVKDPVACVEGQHPTFSRDIASKHLALRVSPDKQTLAVCTQGGRYQAFIISQATSTWGGTETFITSISERVFYYEQLHLCQCLFWLRLFLCFALTEVQTTCCPFCLSWLCAASVLSWCLNVLLWRSSFMKGRWTKASCSEVLPFTHALYRIPPPPANSSSKPTHNCHQLTSLGFGFLPTSSWFQCWDVQQLMFWKNQGQVGHVPFGMGHNELGPERYAHGRKAAECFLSIKLQIKTDLNMSFSGL